MRGELDGDRLLRDKGKLLLDLREVAVLRNAVGAHALVALAEEVVDLRLASRPAHAAHGIRDDPRGTDQPGLQQRQGWNQDAGRIAAGRCHERGVADPVAIYLGQSVDGFREELGGGVIVGVEFLVHRGAAETEIRAEINNNLAGGGQRNGELRRDPVGQGEKDHVRLLRQRGGVRLGKAERARHWMARKSREDAGQGLTGVLTRGHRDQLDTGMMQKEPDEFFAGVAGGADDGDADRIGKRAHDAVRG